MALTAIINEHGGPEQFNLVDLEIGAPAKGEVRIKHKAVGLNFIDVYQRAGLYPIQLPHAMGMEASGVIEAVGEGVTHLKVGDRAAYASNPPGAYAEARVMPAAQVCPLPDEVSFEEGAAMMLKGMTVEYLFHRTVPLKAGDTVLFHAAAGALVSWRVSGRAPKESPSSERQERTKNVSWLWTTARPIASIIALKIGRPNCKS